ncbi:uncharacterized protein LOC128960162 [Oppia nitens]|uniref:uncharacterized protein LOC128960162 n=1 Tax=Oppia nitens TaxID=1686743 RepID=UPI0023DC48D0|nr:uncharacterized protein LOC128960162 [Oppia nitens]
MKFSESITKSNEYKVSTAESKNKSPSQNGYEMPLVYIWIYTLIHFFNHLLFGLTQSMVPPAYVDFKFTTNASLPMIGLNPTFQGVGIFIGSFVTIIFKWVNRQLCLCFVVVIMSLSTIFFPWATTLWQLWLCSLLYGFGVGSWNGCNNVVLVEMWKHRSPSMLLFAQFVWGVGTILGPLLVEAYVIGNDVCPGVTQEECHRQQQQHSNPTTVEPNSRCTEWCLNFDRRPQLKIPFLIGGCLELLGPLCYFIMFFVNRYRYVKDESRDDIEDEEKKREERETRKKIVPKYMILGCMSVVFSCGILAENLYNSFAATFFQYQPVLHVSASKASIISSTMNGAFSLGRFICMFVAVYVSPQNMALVELIITLGGYIFQIFGQNDLILLWISAIIISLGFSSIWISCFSFIARYMTLTDMIGGWMIGPCNITYIVLGYFISGFMTTNPSIFLYISTAGVAISIVAHIVAMISVRHVPKELLLNVDPAQTAH